MSDSAFVNKTIELDTLEKIINALKEDEDRLFISTLESLITTMNTVSKERKKTIFSLIGQLIKNVNNEEELSKFQSKLQAGVVDDIPSVLRSILIDPCDLEAPKEPVILGIGAFGTVHKNFLKKTDGSKNEVAVKTPNDAKWNKMIMEEAAALVNLKHTHVVSIVGFLKDKKYQIVMEYVKGKQLYDLIMESNISQTEALKIMCGVASGMEYIISKKYIHRDLNMNNILLTKKKTAKIADFGLCKYVGDSGGIYKEMGSFMGTDLMVPPEVLTTRIFSEKSDVWAFGLTCLQIDMLCHASNAPLIIKGMLFADFPESFREIAHRLCFFTSAVKFQWFEDRKFQRLMNLCFNQDKDRRPTFTYIHKEMKDIV